VAINIELEKLYYEDKKEREEFNDSKESLKTLEKHDRLRLQKVKRLLPYVDTAEIWNCHYLAYLLIHGETTEDYQLAQEYAKMAVDMGSSVTKWLYAATLDRWLVSQGKPQKFGTQYKIVNGKKELFPVDKNTTDEERIEHGITS
jgi:hypothetical protein